MLTGGNLFVIFGPSGTGKTTLVKNILNSEAGIEVSISYTTRDKRPDEREGKDYFFVSIERFKQLIAENAFLEYAEVYGNYYGTLKEYVTTRLQQGKDIILEIDWQGATQIKRLQKNAILIGLVPPSLETLTRRLETRGQDSAETIALRLRSAVDDSMKASQADYIVVSENQDQVLQDTLSIIRAERLTVRQQIATLPLFSYLKKSQ